MHDHSIAMKKLMKELLNACFVFLNESHMLKYQLWLFPSPLQVLMLQHCFSVVYLDFLSSSDYSYWQLQLLQPTGNFIIVANS